MQKIQETWTSQSVATTFEFLQFHLPAKGLPTKKISSRVSTICTQSCGPGWELALTMVPQRRMHSTTYQLEFRARASCPSLEATVLSVRTILSRSSKRVAAENQPAMDRPAEEFAFPEQQIFLGSPLGSKVAVLWSGADPDEISDVNITLMVTVTGWSETPDTLLDIVPSLFTPPSTSAASPPPQCPPSVLNSVQVLRVLDRSLGDGISFDVKFLTNSKRLSSGSIYKPLPTYANSAVLEEVCPKLDTLFPGGLVCITEDDLPLPILADYDDGYDSDVDDDEGVIEDARSMVSAQANEVERSAQPQDTASPAPPVTKTDPGDIPDAEFDGLCLISSNRADTVLSPSPSADSIADSDFIESALSTRTSHHEAGVQLIHVKCAAHRTWRAFVYYCYTGKVAFYPLRSQMPRNKFPEVAGAPPSCSPKSMYRLADKANLKNRAFNAVKARLSKVNIVDEVLCYFTSRHPDIQKMELDILVENRKEPEVRRALETNIAQLAAGQSPHSAAAFAALFQLLSGAGEA
ncbi:hypothetical protein PAXRUDRAFT_133736 [Paxillus rubicundulus Ve08.2h10]|uniref:Uncharacterized protein n=1 Tax=Paxillus rubicundulus Ve08.2h10 TaxID=930991 RepID=A0A0D0DJN1_9AGAM|nr:hypothetical protein PAXRUDRAFT_133736 [Paxillus rubicundulus Ve08.2h10]